LDEQNLVIKYQSLDEHGQYKIKLLMDAKLTVLEKNRMPQDEKDISRFRNHNRGKYGNG